MNNVPIMGGYREHINMYPKDVAGVWNTSTQFYKRYLYLQIYSRYKLNIPKSWPLNFFRFWLFQYGSIGVIYTREFGWMAQPYSISKLDPYYQPKVCTVYNQFFNDVKVGAVGINFDIIKILDDYYGLDDLVTRYAERLAQVDKSIEINLMNTNLAILFAAESKNQADDVREAVQKAQEGEPFVSINKEALDGQGLQTFFPGVSSNFITDKLLDAKRTIVDEFLTKIGFNNANTDKRERLNTEEVNSNNEEVKSIAELILENIREGMEKVNAISDLNLSVEFTDLREEGVDEIYPIRDAAA